MVEISVWPTVQKGWKGTEGAGDVVGLNASHSPAKGPERNILWWRWRNQTQNSPWNEFQMEIQQVLQAHRAEEGIGSWPAGSQESAQGRQRIFLTRFATSLTGQIVYLDNYNPESPPGRRTCLMHPQITGRDEILPS